MANSNSIKIYFMSNCRPNKLKKSNISVLKSKPLRRREAEKEEATILLIKVLETSRIKHNMFSKSLNNRPDLRQRK